MKTRISKQKPADIRGTRLYYKHNFDKYKVEFVFGSARLDKDKNKLSGGEDLYIERLKSEYSELHQTNLDFLCKQISQIIIRERQALGFIKSMQVTLYDSVTDKVCYFREVL